MAKGVLVTSATKSSLAWIYKLCLFAKPSSLRTSPTNLRRERYSYTSAPPPHPPHHTMDLVQSWDRFLGSEPHFPHFEARLVCARAALGHSRMAMGEWQRGACGSYTGLFSCTGGANAGCWVCAREVTAAWRLVNQLEWQKQELPKLIAAAVHPPISTTASEEEEEEEEDDDDDATATATATATTTAAADEDEEDEDEEDEDEDEGDGDNGDELAAWALRPRLV
ncbi:hypothetical protein BDV95DRAFT_655297 [Massariosphaeria phaeospora]|uniref:Uncharacterized protein n=1 Tax=Massariosphaeria phaeospora TaxID=100035 RepID=A0A7C8IM57_9PLEO|nr:hypothetical protein BDV95DRAFT_655297 [Massariosphaeria phaeospora]